MKNKIKISFIIVIMLFTVILGVSNVKAVEEENFAYYAVAEKGHILTVQMQQVKIYIPYISKCYRKNTNRI